jgi:hypothetical protein
MGFVFKGLSFKDRLARAEFGERFMVESLI